MAPRTCPSCGADVSTASAFCPRCGGDLEAKLIELGGPAPARAQRTSRRDRPKRARLLAGVAAVLVGGLAVTTLVGDDGDSDDDSESEGVEAEATTTTLADLSDLAPLLGEQSGLSVAIAGQANVVIGMDAGSTSYFNISSMRPADAAPSDVGAGLVTVGGTGVYSWRAPYERPSASLDATPAGAAFSGDTVVWSIDPESTVARALQVEAPTGLLLEQTLPSGSSVTGVLGDDLVFGAPGGTFVLGVDGVARLLDPGRPLAAADEIVLVMGCGADLSCTVRSLDANGSELQRVPVEGPGAVIAAAVGVDGQVAWIEGRPGAGFVVVDGRARFPVPSTGIPTLDWSPDGRWLAGSFGRDDIWVLDGQGGPDAAPVTIELGQNVYPEQVMFLSS